MKYNHITIDLETVDNRPTSAITAIGAVFFNLDSDEREKFYVNVDLQSSIDLGLTVSGETIMWWFKQSDSARKALMDPKPIDVHMALPMLNSFIDMYKSKNCVCWTHATFDAPILNYAASLVKVKPPIFYRQHRDIRTLTWLNKRNGEKMKMAPEMTANNALDDAMHQANYITNHLNSVIHAIEAFEPLSETSKAIIDKIDRQEPFKMPY